MSSGWYLPTECISLLGYTMHVEKLDFKLSEKRIDFTMCAFFFFNF